MTFSKLKVYQIAIELEEELYSIIKRIPYHLNNSLCDQITRSSSSVSANIVEGCGRNAYPKEFIKFLYYSLSSCDETQHHLRVLSNRDLIKNEVSNELMKKYKNLSVRILNLIQYLKNLK